jgi:RNA polymerase sigma-70 factor (ECF subfamily)
LASEGEDPDLALLEGVGRGEQAAVRRLLDARLPRILALARRLLADPDEAQDVAQETFLRAWKQAPSWRPGQARFDTWLHRVALNLCRDRLRRRRETAMAQPPEVADLAPNGEGALLGAQIGGRIETALAALPERQREAIVLCHHQGLGNKEAAALLEVSVETLESLLGRGRRALRAALADLMEAVR